MYRTGPKVVAIAVVSNNCPKVLCVVKKVKQRIHWVCSLNAEAKELRDTLREEIAIVTNVATGITVHL